jgi:hypothetical protein
VEDLAELEQAAARDANSETLYRRAISLREQQFPGEASLAESLEHYASLLKRMGRSAEAAQVEARAKGIRTKLAETPPK